MPPRFVSERGRRLLRLRKAPLPLKTLKVIGGQQRHDSEFDQGLEPIAERLPRERQRSVTPRGRLETFGGHPRQRLDSVGDAAFKREGAVPYVLDIVPKRTDQKRTDALPPARGLERHFNGPDP